MNFQGEELKKVPEHLLETLKDVEIPVDLNAILELVPLPDLGGLTNSFKSLLPQNLTTISVDGISQLLNPQALQEAIQNGVNDVKGLVEQQIKQALDQAMSVTNEVVGTAQSIVSEIAGLGQALTSLNIQYLDNALTKFLGVAGTMGVDTTQIAQIQSSFSPVLQSIQNLSPKQLRDLQDPAKYAEFLDTAVNTATQLVGDQAINQALQSVAPSLNIQTLANLFKEGVGLFSTTGEGGAQEYDELVEINTYYAKGEGADVDAAQKKSVTGRQLQSGKSCAVDNARIMFGSKVTTSLGTFEAVDKSKIPSSSGSPVISLFYETQEEAIAKDLELISSGKKKQVVKVTPTGGTYTQRNLETRGTEYNLF